MINKKQLTLEQTSVLLWIKALNNFRDPDNLQDSLNTKINKFNIEVSNIELRREIFESSIDDLCDLGILKKIKDEEEIELIMQGRAILTALSTIESLSDETIQKILNNTISVVELAKKHWLEITNIVISILLKV